MARPYTTGWYYRATRAAALCALLALAGVASAQTAGGTWRFAVAGDSRNCGDLVMPAIAADVRRERAAFYWHLGDLRKIRDADQDFLSQRRFQPPAVPPTAEDYHNLALPDFIEHQVRPFGDMPFFVGIGNHETIAPSSRLQFQVQMKALLDRPELRAQRRADGYPEAALAPGALPPTYFHWHRAGVDFIYLDNATADAFDDAQLSWLDRVLRDDLAHKSIRSIVVGMHEALPHSLGDFHSMCATQQGVVSGERVYRALADAQRAGKQVYVLASHSHFYLAGIYDTAYWRAPEHGGVVLPGWIVGTAGAERYPLPPGVEPGPGARSLTYGYLSATVARSGHIDFAFREVDTAALRAHLPPDLTEDIIDTCVEHNPSPAGLARPWLPTACDAGH